MNKLTDNEKREKRQEYMKWYNKKYYEKNKNKIIGNVKKRQQDTDYASEKTPAQKIIRNIKRKTRYYFRLNGHNCEFCTKKAEEHHHNTSPIEFDKFNFVCRKCHKNIHKNIRRLKK